MTWMEDEEIEAMSQEEIASLLIERRLEHRELIRSLQPAMDALRKKFPETYQRLDLLEKKGVLKLSPTGTTDAHILYEGEEPRFILKRANADILCYNNSKDLASPWNDDSIYHRLYRDIPLYQSVQSDVLSYLTSLHLGLRDLVPRTVMITFTRDEEQDLCSAQTFIQHEGMERFGDLLERWTDESCNLGQIYHLQLEAEGKRPYTKEVKEYLEVTAKAEQAFRARLLHKLDLDNFFEMHLHAWVIGKVSWDIHDMIAIPMGERYALWIVNNSKAWPQNNMPFEYHFMRWPQSYHPFSEKYLQLIAKIPIVKIIEDLKLFQMKESIEAFKDRVELLQDLVLKPKMTIYEICLRFQLLGRKDEVEIVKLPDFRTSKDLAFDSSLSLQELETLLKKTLETVSQREIHLHRQRMKG